MIRWSLLSGFAADRKQTGTPAEVGGSGCWVGSPGRAGLLLEGGVCAVGGRVGRNGWCWSARLEEIPLGKPFPVVAGCSLWPVRPVRASP